MPADVGHVSMQELPEKTVKNAALFPRQELEVFIQRMD